MAPQLVLIGDRTYSVPVTSVPDLLTWDKANSFLTDNNFHVGMIVALPTDNPDEIAPIVAIGLEAEPEENPWHSLRRSINHAQEQLARDAPGFVAIHYSDHMSDQETLRDRRDPSLFHGIVHEIQRSNVEAVLIWSEPNLQRPGHATSGQFRLYAKLEWMESELFESFKSLSTGQTP